MFSLRTKLKNNSLVKGYCLSLYWLWSDYIPSHVISHIPFWIVRKILYHIYGASFGNGSQMDMNVTVMGLNNLVIGNHCHINRGCIIDSPGG